MAHVTADVMNVVAQAYMPSDLAKAADNAHTHAQAVAFGFSHAFQIVLTERDAIPAAK
jgi:hypothetical protein